MAIDVPYSEVGFPPRKSYIGFYLEFLLRLVRSNFETVLPLVYDMV